MLRGRAPRGFLKHPSTGEDCESCSEIYCTPEIQMEYLMTPEEDCPGHKGFTLTTPEEFEAAVKRRKKCQ